jgi:hypothetical protein
MADRDQLREAWEKGYVAGRSITMRRMSDEPKAPDYANPYASDDLDLPPYPQNLMGDL